ncbi:DUF5518 domain-containing protein [Halorubrum coriense]|uniref:DUF5518 domain-containing protein n=1 Tax=Halorubrum coriense TaxID=64713 RepID=UPI0009B5C80D|nr:DUF5518 domain-containing protein [Halorubrum coriense]
MLANARTRRIPQVWRVAILGALAALPATVILNWLPNSEATVGGGVMIVGALIAGAIATRRSVEPSAAGLRAGFLGGATAVAVFLIREGTTVVWSLNTSVFFAIAIVMVLSFTPVFGLIFGRIGGWVANTVADSGVDQAA